MKYVAIILIVLASCATIKPVEIIEESAHTEETITHDQALIEIQKLKNMFDAGLISREEYLERRRKYMEYLKAQND